MDYCSIETRLGLAKIGNKVNGISSVSITRAGRQIFKTSPYVKTTSYLKLPKQLGDGNAIRVVVNANGKNPFWISTPCHRGISSDGHLTVFAGGL
jgi:O-6-methylguanine DNA methyltransferase